MAGDRGLIAQAFGGEINRATDPIASVSGHASTLGQLQRRTVAGAKGGGGDIAAGSGFKNTLPVEMAVFVVVEVEVA